MTTINIQYYQSPFGELILGEFKGRLCLCDWRYRKKRTAIDERVQNYLQAKYNLGASKILNQVSKELDEYFSNRRKQFDVPILFAGTDFQKSVWQQLLLIPYGETESYKGLSIQLNNEKAIRAIASANGANAISIIVPCHRIVGSNGELVGYAGGVQAKRKLLDLESEKSQPEQLKLF